MRAPTDVPRLRDYGSMLIRVWPLILVATLLSAGAALGVSELRKPTYSASVDLFATLSTDPSTFSSYYGSQGAQSRIPTYASLAKSTQVTQRAIDELHLPTTPEDLGSRVTATWTPFAVDPRGHAESVVLRVSVTADTKEAAVKEVNAVGGALMAVSRELEWYEPKLGDENHQGPVAQLVPTVAAQTAESVPVPVVRTLALGAGVGLAVSVLIMLAVEISRGVVDSRGQLDHIVKRAMKSNA